MKRWLGMAVLGMAAWPPIALADDGMYGGPENRMMPPGGMAAEVPASAAAKIASAMSAAPRQVSESATIMDYPGMPDGKPVLLREGSNGWTCFPDNPQTPGNDPMCVDQQWMRWIQAWISHTRPHITGVGIAYMLQGGSDASNTDPFAEKPAPGQNWMQAPPHVMVLNPGRWDGRMFPAMMGGGSAPWVMFKGTPYEHLMMPVQ